MSATARSLGEQVETVQAVLPGEAGFDAGPVRFERLSAARHAAQIFEAQQGQDWVWDYMPIGPFADEASFRLWMKGAESSADPCFYAIIRKQDDKTVGYASFMRIEAANGVIEIGNILLTPELQRSREAGAALMAMVGWAFENGYRRLEWKCNALNLPSRRAALRLGFSYEGTFRQHMIIKGRNRDTAWFAITDADWQALAPAYAAWLAPDNFGPDGSQRQSLSVLTEAALPGRRDPAL
ncbi:GNAT family N-acetyltransferase [Paracoccus caeni]|uniref:GNAT family N-acetyltransferase n=1 Tax=Paracoccus caeni TaxID=657651 RepID=A0A934SDU1_9RHOB|nr:GNAT family protein [Paracoccus caeni]MBK4217056.1 GNAT family N-acetyltransferase [Paracoccus caeni]